MLSYRALFPVAALGRHRRRPSLLRSSPLRRSSLLGAPSERSPPPLPTAFAFWSFARRFLCRPRNPLLRCASHISSGRRHRAFCSAPLLGRPPAVTCRSAKAHRVFSPPPACHLCTHASTGASPTAVRRARKHRPRRSLVPQSADTCGRGRAPGRDGAHVSVVKFQPSSCLLSFALSSLEVGSRLFSPCIFFSRTRLHPPYSPTRRPLRVTTYMKNRSFFLILRIH